MEDIMSENKRRLTFEQCIRLMESLNCPEEMGKAERAKLLEFAERAILDYWTLCQLLGGTIQVCVDTDGSTCYLPVPGKDAIKVKDWPPPQGKEQISEPVDAEKSGLYSPNWSGEHKAASLSGEHSTDWLTRHPEAKPRQRFSL
jgi:hypothetical protein